MKINKNKMTIIISSLLLFGCSSESDSDSHDTTPIKEEPVIEVPDDFSDVCKYHSVDDVYYPINKYISELDSGSKVIKIGYKLDEYSDNIILHSPCEAAYQYTDSDLNPWQESWFFEGSFYRDNDLPTHIAYFNHENKWYVSEEKWVTNNTYKKRPSGEATYKKYLILNDYDYKMVLEEWRMDGVVLFTGQDSNYIYHRDRIEGSAKNDYTFTQDILLDWYENDEKIKHKKINEDSGYQVCIYYIDNNDYYDAGCVSEDYYDSTFNFK